MSFFSQLFYYIEPYLLCFFFCRYVFTITSYLIGVFIFATIVGQVGNVITNRNANRLEFERLLDGAKTYMRHHKVIEESKNQSFVVMQAHTHTCNSKTKQLNVFLFSRCLEEWNDEFYDGTTTVGHEDAFKVAVILIPLSGYYLINWKQNWHFMLTWVY